MIFNKKITNLLSSPTSFVLLAVASIGIVNVLPSYSEIQVDIMKNADTQGCEVNEACYSDTALIIKAGETVNWKNTGKKAHSIISGSSELGEYGWFNSGTIIPNKSFSHKFIEPGQFFYYCQTHPWMNGIIMAI